MFKREEKNYIPLHLPPAETKPVFFSSVHLPVGRLFVVSYSFSRMQLRTQAAEILDDIFFFLVKHIYGMNRRILRIQPKEWLCVSCEWEWSRLKRLTNRKICECGLLFSIEFLAFRSSHWQTAGYKFTFTRVSYSLSLSGEKKFKSSMRYNFINNDTANNN